MSPKAENSPVYAVPCKKKTSKKGESACGDFDEENNKMEIICSTCEDPSKLVDPSVFVVFEDEPANALLGKKKTESACNELDGERNKMVDVRCTDKDPSDNPAYALPLKKTTAKEAESACCELDEGKNKTEDTRL